MSALLFQKLIVLLSFPEKIAYYFQDCKKEEEEIEQGGPQAVYEIKRELGTGTFASVKLAVHRTTGEEVAIKIIDKKKFMQKAKRKDSLMDEVRVLTSISHPHVLQIRGVFETPTTLYLVLELAIGGDLFDRVAQGGQPEPVAKEIFTQMLLAMKYLHAQGIVHRDLKPENILLKSATGNDIKISDFGLSRIIDEGTYMKTICGTPQYVAPEILTKAEKEGYGKAVDMWSLGVILFILLSGYAPFEEEETKRVSLFEKIKSGKYAMNPKHWKHISEDAKDLIRHLLVIDPTTRYTAEQALAHPWISVGTGNDSNNNNGHSENKNSSSPEESKSRGQNKSDNDNKSKSDTSESDKHESSVKKEENDSTKNNDDNNSDEKNDSNTRTTPPSPKSNTKSNTKTNNRKNHNKNDNNDNNDNKTDNDDKSKNNNNHDNDNNKSPNGDNETDDKHATPLSARRKRSRNGNTESEEKKEKKEKKGKTTSKRNRDEDDDAEKDTEKDAEKDTEKEKEETGKRRSSRLSSTPKKSAPSPSPAKATPSSTSPKKRGRKPAK